MTGEETVGEGGHIGGFGLGVTDVESKTDVM